MLLGVEQPREGRRKGIKLIESVNKALLKHLGGDGGTQDISRVLRVPGTFNFKLPDNPREVTSIWMDGPKYDFDDFLWLIEEQQNQNLKEASKKKPKGSTSPQNDQQPGHKSSGAIR